MQSWQSAIKSSLPVMLPGLMVLLYGYSPMIHPAGAGNKPVRVMDQGTLESHRSALVICENGARVSVTQSVEVYDDMDGLDIDPPPRPPRFTNSAVPGRGAFVPDICAYPLKGKAVCKTDWTIDQAAVQACALSK